MLKRFKLVHLAVLMACSLSWQTYAENVAHKIEKKNSESALELLRADGHYKIFLRAIEYAGMSEIVHEHGPYTIFAPTDEAFLKCDFKDELLKNKAVLAAVLKCHLVPFSRMDAKNLAPLKLAMPLSSEELDFSEDGGKIKVNEAIVVHADLKAVDGTAHGIDNVLLPRDFFERFVRRQGATDAKAAENAVFSDIKK